MHSRGSVACREGGIVFVCFSFLQTIRTSSARKQSDSDIGSKRKGVGDLGEESLERANVGQLHVGRRAAVREVRQPRLQERHQLRARRSAQLRSA